jgi:hypothetical protein
MKHLKYFKAFEHLSYDEMDLRGIDHKLVGRHFKSVEDATEYLKKLIEDEGYEEFSISDFDIVDDKGGTLSPFKIYRKPNELELRRKEASEFIKKYGIISSPDLRYITHP